MQSTINDHSATIGTCVIKDENGNVTSDITLSADHVSIHGDTIVDGTLSASKLDAEYITTASFAQQVGDTVLAKIEEGNATFTGNVNAKTFTAGDGDYKINVTSTSIQFKDGSETGEVAPYGKAYFGSDNGKFTLFIWKDAEGDNPAGYFKVNFENWTAVNPQIIKNFLAQNGYIVIVDESEFPRITSTTNFNKVLVAAINSDNTLLNKLRTNLPQNQGMKQLYRYETNDTSDTNNGLYCEATSGSVPTEDNVTYHGQFDLIFTNVPEVSNVTETTYTTKSDALAAIKASVGENAVSLEYGTNEPQDSYKEVSCGGYTLMLQGTPTIGKIDLTEDNGALRYPVKYVRCYAYCGGNYEVCKYFLNTNV